MADVLKLVPFILKWEGGFVNDPDDLGGATNKGITIATFTHYRSSKGLPTPSVEELKNIGDDEWLCILKTMYWDRWQADKIQNQSIANILVDWVWASGVHGIKRPQKILGVNADGVVGQNTLSSLNRQSSEYLFNKIYNDRVAFINDICASRAANQKFKKGWLNRISSLTFKP